MSVATDIGTELRRERESRGWSLRDVTHRTRIPVQTLEALEKNDYRTFPSTAYAKGFLAQYCEHLEIEAVEWLDNFETGNSLANLDRYGYLSDPDEFLGEEVLPLKKAPPRPVHRTRSARKARPKHQADEPTEPRSKESATTLQPLVVFLITASLLTAAAFGYRHLSKAVATDDAGAPSEAAPGFVEAPHIVHSRPAPTKPLADAPPTPPAVAAAIVAEEPGAAPIARALPVQPDGTSVTFEAPPPRAVIVEE